jgi:hypothetical protein
MWVMNESAAIQKYLQEEFSIACRENAGFRELKEKLSTRINQLINEDFGQLVRILYRIDVNENRLRALLRENSGQDAADLIAQLIIDRQLEKIKSREQFKSKGKDLPGEERW